jgi:MFS family permease
MPTATPVSDGPYRRGLRCFRWHAALTFAFAWVPVMFTAFTVDRGFSAAQYLQLWSAYYLAMVSAELPWGWVADRWGQRRLLVLGPLWLGACFIALGELTGFRACWLLLAATGAGHAMISGADSAYLYELVSGAGRVGEALHEETVAHRWRLFGVSVLDVLGGLVAHAAGTRWAFHLGAVAMLGAALAAAGLPSTGRRAGGLGQPSLLGLLRSLSRPGVGRALLWYVAVFVLLRVGFQLYQPTLLARGASDLRLHGLLFGLLNLAAGPVGLRRARRAPSPRRPRHGRARVCCSSRPPSSAWGWPGRSCSCPSSACSRSASASCSRSAARPSTASSRRATRIRALGAKPAGSTRLRRAARDRPVGRRARSRPRPDLPAPGGPRRGARARLQDVALPRLKAAPAKGILAQR